MKRGPGPKRTTPLAPNPEATRAWQQCSRENAPLNRGGPLERAVTAQIRRDDARRATDAPARTPVRFKARRPARLFRCFRCNRQAHHWHHWLTQEYLKVYMRGIRRRDGLTDEQHDKRLRDLLRDERNLSPVCHHCHGQGTSHADAFTAKHVPASALEFAAELGPEWAERLRRSYPARGARGQR